MEDPKKIVMIAALGLNREIGAAGSMPWRLPTDMKRFRELTRGHSVIMGRVTFITILEALRKPLPKRQNIVVTRSDFAYPGVTVASSVDEAIAKSEMPGPIFIAGGGQIYRLALPLAHEMWLTHVYGAFPEADTFFPPWTDYQWFIEDAGRQRGESDSHDTGFRIWRKARCDL